MKNIRYLAIRRAKNRRVMTCASTESLDAARNLIARTQKRSSRALSLSPSHDTYEIRRVTLDDTERVDPPETDQEAYERSDRVMCAAGSDVEHLKPIVSSPFAGAFAGAELDVEITVTWNGDLRDQDLHYYPWPMLGRSTGGQHVMSMESGVLVEHKPTGICAHWSDERSQIKNCAKALEQLRKVLAAIKGAA